PAAVLNIALEGGSLVIIVQNVSGGVQEHQHGVLGQILIGELRGILRGRYGEVVFGAQFLDRGNPILDGIVSITGGLGEYKDRERRAGGRGQRIEDDLIISFGDRE